MANITRDERDRMEEIMDEITPQPNQNRRDEMRTERPIRDMHGGLFLDPDPEWSEEEERQYQESYDEERSQHNDRLQWLGLV